MKKFKVISHQLEKSKKWIPAGTLFNYLNNGSKIDVQEVGFPKNEFGTKKDADDFFRKYYINKGFTEK